MTRRVTRTESVNSRKAFGLTRVNQYTLLKKVGTGAFGEVFMAIEPSKRSDLPDKTYAVKIINRNKLPGRGLNEALKNEINSLSGLHHPNIVHLKEVIDDPDAPNLYLVMQFLTGQSMQDRINTLEKSETKDSTK